MLVTVDSTWDRGSASHCDRHCTVLRCDGMDEAVLTGLFTLGGAGVGAMASYLGASSGARRAQRDDLREAARLIASEFRANVFALEAAIERLEEPEDVHHLPGI